jgi:hypothetical protein
MTKVVEYSSNNSGGEWWLTDKDWVALEKAGWNVEWGGKYYCTSPIWKIPEDAFICDEKECKGHLKYKSIEEVDANDDRFLFLGAAAIKATREGLDLEAAIREFESVTGQNASASGCHCCGSPHHFSETDEEES